MTPIYLLVTPHPILQWKKQKSLLLGDIFIPKRADLSEEIGKWKNTVKKKNSTSIKH